MRALDVTFRASLPAVSALNQNRPPSPDSVITVLAIIMIQLIVDSAAPFSHWTEMAPNPLRVKELHSLLRLIFTGIVLHYYDLQSICDLLRHLQCRFTITLKGHVSHDSWS